jgi:hypothetical protein
VDIGSGIVIQAKNLNECEIVIHYSILLFKDDTIVALYTKIKPQEANAN